MGFIKKAEVAAVKIVAFVPGKCHLCNKATEDDACTHYECAIAYCDKKEVVIKKYYEETGN